MECTPATRDATRDESDFVGPVLVVRLEKETVGCFRLEKSRMIMGRSRRADIVLDESGGVSREHAHVLVIENEVVVEDLGSRNGTYVNGKPTDRRTLRPGDRIAIGRYRLRFHDGSAQRVEAQPARPALHLLLRRWRRAETLGDGQGCPLCRGAKDNEKADSLTRSRTMRCLQPDTDAMLAMVDALVSAGPRTHEAPRQPGAHRLYDRLKERAPKRKRVTAPRARLQRVRGRRAQAPHA